LGKDFPGRIASRDSRTASIGICGEHAGGPESVYVCHEVGVNYVSCSRYRPPAARLASAQAAIADFARCDHVERPENFIAVWRYPAGYQAQFPNCDINNGDVNLDGAVNTFDIDPFVQYLTVGCH
jgi:hypothetical protein